MSNTTDFNLAQEHQPPGQPWLRLLLVMTVPVLLLLVGISLTR